jgi:hypothetical protein
MELERVAVIAQGALDPKLREPAPETLLALVYMYMHTCIIVVLENSQRLENDDST